MLKSSQNHLYKLLWEYDPNALIALDSDLIIRVVNPSFCQLFKLENTPIIGQLATDILGNIDHIKEAWQKKQVIKNRETEYLKHDIIVKEFIFPIQEENFILCIMTDITAKILQQKELKEMQEEMINKVNKVVHNQMKVAQEIAGLLGETTAETKVTLFKLLALFNK
jgi:PAS domain S-box-containing protein